MPLYLMVTLVVDVVKVESDLRGDSNTVVIVKFCSIDC